MPKYRKRPIVVEASQFIGDCVPDGIFKDKTSSTGLSINTLAGKHEVSEGDFIVIGIEGEMYPVKPEIFNKTYERVKDDDYS